MGLFDKIKKIGIFKGFSKLDDEFYDNLEESIDPGRHGGGDHPQGRRPAPRPHQSGEN